LEEDLLIKKAISRGVPVLGICLGAQLIAKAGGAKVWKGSKKEIGWYPVRLTKEGRDDPLFKGFGEMLTVFQWHGDTFDLPEGGVLLAKNDIYNQAFKLGSAYALQFHLEVTGEMISQWLTVYKDEVESMGGLIDVDVILRETVTHIKRVNDLARSLIKAWLYS
jgi:GMP synthase-like glutamine amidotransferase